METLEGNKLIGIFDGWYQKDLPKNGDINWFNEKYSTKITNKAYIPSAVRSFKYHTSWDWLIPVVEKIEAIEDNYHGHFGVHICSNGCTIQATNFRSNKPMPDPPHYFNDVTAES